jgi:hypothetical protein
MPGGREGCCNPRLDRGHVAAPAGEWRQGGQARRECPGRSIRIRSQQQQFRWERASLTAWIVRYPEHGLSAPADLDLGSIKKNNPIGSAMLNDEAGGTIRADVYGHSSPEGEMRLPFDALYLG